MNDNKYIKFLFKEIDKALKKEEVPVAALIVCNDTGKIIAKKHNKREVSHETINHAEILCISKANKRLKRKYLDNCSLYVTLEPCDMCKSIIKESRINSVYYLLPRNAEKKQYYKTNFLLWDNVLDKQVEYQQILTNFFKKRR